MKKTLATLIVLMLTIALMTACNSSDKTTSSSEDKQASTSQQDSSTSDDPSNNDNSTTSKPDDQAMTSEGNNQSNSSSSLESADNKSENQANQRSLDMLGSSADGSYTNDYFGFSLQYPKDWYVMSDVELIQAMVAGLQDSGMTVDNFNLNDVEALMLFGTTEENFNAPSKTFLSNLVINAEEQIGFNASITPNEYANIAIDQLKGYGYDISDIDDLVIDGKDFSSFEVSLTTNEMTIAQRYYFVKLDDYMFNFVFSYNEESKDFVLSMLDSITFTK